MLGDQQHVDPVRGYIVEDAGVARGTDTPESGAYDIDDTRAELVAE